MAGNPALVSSALRVGEAPARRPLRSNHAIEVSTRSLIVFTRQLAAMYGAGTPILKALETLAKQCDDLPLAIVLTNIAWQVRHGQSLAKAFDAQPASFPPIYRALLREGEASGTLHKCLLAL